MIADEVITGFGRTGRWFGCDHEAVVPDLMSMAKGITSGYVPLSASIARAHLADAFPDGTTQENVHPNTCAAALANLRIIEQDGLVENAEKMGAELLAELTSAVGRHSIVGEVRGRGLMVCVDLVEPDGSGRPLDAERVADLDRKAWDRGAIVYARGSVLLAGSAPVHHAGGGRSPCRHGGREYRGLAAGHEDLRHPRVSSTSLGPGRSLHRRRTRRRRAGIRIGWLSPRLSLTWRDGPQLAAT
jgi:aminotransferase class III